MAELLEPTGEFVPERRHYPWDEWLDGQARRLTLDHPDRPGDICNEPANFRPYVYAMARKRGLKVAIVLEPDAMTIQAYHPGTPRPKLPSPYARHANGRPDGKARADASPTNDPARPAPPACRHCQAPLSTVSLPHGECRSAKAPAWRCTSGVPKP